jgi:uncharacterized protein (TIGR03435 family)
MHRRGYLRHFAAHISIPRNVPPPARYSFSEAILRSTIATILTALAAFGFFCDAQIGGFEVASIRRNLSGAMNTRINLLPGGRLVINNATLKTLVRNAYGLLSFQFTGAPGWFDDDKYDINAITGRPENITPEDFKRLLQNLLSNRFHLVVHWETKEAPMYALLTEKGGPKFHTSSGGPEHGMNTRKAPGKVQMTGRDVPMSELASNVANQLGRWVEDETGLPDHYDFSLEWDPDQTSDASGPSLFAALREQLGLRLAPRTGPVKVLAIDHAERPDAN